MITFVNDDKKIQYSLNNIVYECNEGMYIIQMPTLACNNRKDAEFIQLNINTYISELSRAVLNNK